MPRFRYEVTEKNTQRKIKAGRGQGEGKEFQSYLEVFDLSSSGTTSRSPGVQSDHIDTTLSRGETLVQAMYNLSGVVVEVQEQPPLLPREETETIAKLLGIVHPADRKTKVNVVMTTDFLIKVRLPDGRIISVVRSVKYLSDLKKRNVFEHLEIERMFYLSRQIDWGLVIVDLIPVVVKKNCRRIWPFYHLKGISDDDFQRIYSTLTPLTIEGKLSLYESAKECDQLLGLVQGKSINAAQHFIATKRWQYDFTMPFDTAKPIKILSALPSY